MDAEAGFRGAANLEVETRGFADGLDVLGIGKRRSQYVSSAPMCALVHLLSGD